MELITRSGASPAEASVADERASSPKAPTTPMTVPSSPTKGALFPTVPRNSRRFSMRARKPEAAAMASPMAVPPLSHCSSPARPTAASTLGDAASRLRAASKFPSERA